MVSIACLARYFSSRLTTVNSSSRAGRVRPWSPTCDHLEDRERVSDGASDSTEIPTSWAIGSTASTTRGRIGGSRAGDQALQRQVTTAVQVSIAAK